MTITRIDVINNASRYIPPRMPAWTPRNDTQENFHSAFVCGIDDPVTGQCIMREYNVFPYVYGRYSILKVTQFLSAVGNDTCPGGWDRQTGWGTGHFFNTRRLLAGIDCSEYVMSSWGFERKLVDGIWYGTANLPRICLQISKDKLAMGDILLRRGHVRIFGGWVDQGKNNVWAYEAAGARDENQARRKSLQRPFNPSDDQGCVGRWRRPWDSNYKPYSPFPQFKLFKLASSSNYPVFKIEIAGSGELELVYFMVNNRLIFSREISNNSNINVIYAPKDGLKTGYKLDIRAINRICGQSFQDDKSFEYFPDINDRLYLPKQSPSYRLA